MIRRVRVGVIEEMIGRIFVSSSITRIPLTLKPKYLKKLKNLKYPIT